MADPTLLAVDALFSLNKAYKAMFLTVFQLKRTEQPHSQEHSLWFADKSDTQSQGIIGSVDGQQQLFIIKDILWIYHYGFLLQSFWQGDDCSSPCWNGTMVAFQWYLPQTALLPLDPTVIMKCLHLQICNLDSYHLSLSAHFSSSWITHIFNLTLITGQIAAVWKAA